MKTDITNIQNKTHQDNNNQKIFQNYSEVNLSQLPILLHNSILNWETKQRQCQPYFSGYDELAILLNLHPQTLRKFSNQYSGKFPPVNVLIGICKITGDFTPLNYITDYSKQI